MMILRLLAFTRSVALLVLVLLALTAFAWICTRLSTPGDVVPTASISDQVKAPAPLLPESDAVRVAERVDSSSVEIRQVPVQSARRYAATVTVETKRETIALAVRQVDPGWFHEFRLRRADPVAVDLLPGYEASVLTVEQRLPLIDVELAPQIGAGISRNGVGGVVALTAVRLSGVHLGGFAGLGPNQVLAGGYVSVKPRPAFSLGLGYDVLHQQSALTLTINL